MRFLVERELRSLAGTSGVDREHRDYWRRRFHEGVVLYAGSWTDAAGDTLLLDVPEPRALHATLAGDPYARAGLVTRTRVRRLGDLVPVRAGKAGQPHPVHVESGRSGHARLTPYENRVARMMLDGLTNRQMADVLGVSARAVEQHITRIYRKLAISRRAQLAQALERSASEPVRHPAPTAG